MALIGSLAKKIFQAKSHNKHRGAYYGGAGAMGGYYAGSHYRPHYRSGYHHSGYRYRPENYEKIIGQTCVNRLEFDGVVLNAFVCPIEGINSIYLKHASLEIKLNQLRIQC